MLSTIDISIIFAYLALMIAIGVYAGRKQDSVEDFFIAGGRVGTFSIACLWLATYAGGASVVGGVAKAYEFGISGAWFIVCIMIGCLLFGLFFASRVKRWGTEGNLLTYPDLIESKYDSRTRVVATITTIVSYIGYAAGQLAAAGAILSTLLGWDYSSSLLLASTIIVIYTATGGFLAITYTDWVQFALLFIGVVLVGIPIAIANGGTWESMSTQLSPGHFNPTAWGVPAMLAMSVSIPLTFFVAMDSYTRMFAARDEKVARRGTLLAALFFLPLVFGTAWLGMTAAVLFPDADNSSNILSTFVLATFPIGLKGLMFVGILAALMSTADICILTASANGSRDIYQRFINPDVSPENLFRISVGLAATVGVASTLIAWQMQDIVSILLIAFTINSAALFVPTLAMAIRPRVNTAAAFWSITLSLITVIGWYVGSTLELATVFSIESLWPGLLVSMLVYAGISFFSDAGSSSGSRQL